MDYLREFNFNTNAKEALIEFITAYIANEGVNRMFRGENVEHIGEAKRLIDDAFQALNDKYAIPTKEKDNINPAR